jgi:aquaporin Z
VVKPLQASDSTRERRAREDFDNPHIEWRRLFAEFWGTFLTVMVTLGGLMALEISHGQIGYGLAKLASGLAVTAVIYLLGEISGAHLNPAVTLAFAARSHFPWTRAPGYVLAQTLGAVIAGYVLLELIGPVADIGASTPRHVSAWNALALEVVLTAGLVTTILGTASGGRNVGPNGALAVGFYVALAGIWAGPLEGASMNPVRSLAPDIVRGNFATTWIYVAGPFVGALIGVAIEWLLKGSPSEEGDRTAQGRLGKQS